MFINYEDVRTWIKIGFIVLTFATAIVAKIVAGVIGNKRLEYLLNASCVVCIVFVVLRIIAAIVDSNIDIPVGILTTIITYAFNAIPLFILLKLLFNLKQQEMLHTAEGLRINPNYVNKSKLSKSIDDVLDELNFNRGKINEIEQAILQHQSNDTGE